MNSIYLISKYLSEDEPYSTVFSKKHSVASFFTYPTFWNLIIFGNFHVTTTDKKGPCHNTCVTFVAFSWSQVIVAILKQPVHVGNEYASRTNQIFIAGVVLVTISRNPG